MDIRKKLIIDLASEDNIPFLIDLNDILPEVFGEFRSRLFENKINMPDGWIGYKVFRSNKEMVYIASHVFSGDGVFRFSIYTGNSERNLYYGITGPFSMEDTISEVKDLLEDLQKRGFRRRQIWMFRYFMSQRDSLFDCIRNKQNIDIAFAPFAEEFFTKCGPIKDSLERANQALIR